MRLCTYRLIAALLAATLLSTGAFSETVKQPLPVPNQCLDGLDVVNKQLKRAAPNAQTKQDKQNTLKYANQIVVDALTYERTNEPLQELILCLHNSVR